MSADGDKFGVRLPPRVKAAVDTLLESLQKHAKDQLVSVLLHGSAVRGGYRESTSDIDLVVVLKDDPIELLETIGADLLLARNSARVEGMILKQSELARAADVFPVFYSDLARSAVVLWGENPFASITIHDSHRRLRVEQELREARIRLRLGIADAAAGFLKLEGVVDRKLKQIRSPLYAMALLAKKEPPSESLADVLKTVGKMLDVDVETLLGTKNPAPDKTKTLVRLLDAAIEHADREERAEEAAIEHAGRKEHEAEAAS